MLALPPTTDSPTLPSGRLVGDTDPSLLRAMGGGTSALVHNVGLIREIVGQCGDRYGAPSTPWRVSDDAKRFASHATEVGRRQQRRASEPLIAQIKHQTRPKDTTK